MLGALKSSNETITTIFKILLWVLMFLSQVYTCEPYTNQTICVWFVDLISSSCTYGEHIMNHSTAHEHPFVFAQKTDKFHFTMSCLLTVRVCFMNSVHIYERLVCEPYANGLVCKCVLALKIHR